MKGSPEMVKAKKSLSSLVENSPMMQDVFGHFMIGQSKNPVWAYCLKLWNRKDNLKRPPKAKGGGEYLDLGGFFIEIEGLFDWYIDFFVPLMKKMNSFRTANLPVDELRTKLDGCNMELVSVIAERYEKIFHCTHKLLWIEQGDTMCARVCHSHIWRTYNDARDFLSYGCEEVDKRVQAKDSEIITALVSLSSQMDRLSL